MLNETGFDLWADGYDQSVGLSEEQGSYPFAGYRSVVELALETAVARNGRSLCLSGLDLLAADRAEFGAVFKLSAAARTKSHV